MRASDGKTKPRKREKERERLVGRMFAIYPRVRRVASIKARGSTILRRRMRYAIADNGETAA